MRDFIIIISIALIVFIPSYYSEKYLTNTGTSIVKKLEVIEEEIEIDKMENLDEVVIIKDEWNSVENYWNMLLNHQITDNIELSFTRLLISYGEKEKAECLVNIAEIISLIEDAPRTERMDWANIF